MSKLKEVKGITLIALVITIIVLLILAGVSIATLTGQDGILTKASESKTTTAEKSAKEAVEMVLDEWQIENYTGTLTLQEFLEDKATENIIDGVVANADGTFEVEKDGYLGTISADGELTEIAKAGLRPQVTNIRVVKASDGTGENLNKGSIYTESMTNLYIMFEHNIEGGITTVTPSLPFKVTENGKYSFTVTGIVNGEEKIKTVRITVDQFSTVKIGDFINYSAGIWKQEEINDLEEVKLYSGTELPTKSNPYQFGGFKAGDSKDKSSSLLKGKEGWKVLSINDNNSINIIHSGTPERILSSKPK